MPTNTNTKKSPKKSSAPKAAKAPKPAPKPSYRDHFDRFAIVAQGIPEAEVQPCRADLRVAAANVRLGLKAVLATPEQIAFAREHLPKLSIDDLLELPDLSRALVFSSGFVVGRAASPKEIERRLGLISAPREQLLDQAEILAKRQKLDKDRVAKIRAGSGKYDMAHDAVALADLFLENENALKGMHPFKRAELQELREHGEWLLENLTPAGARSESKKSKTPAEQTRDRLWTLTALRHQQLRKLGYYLHGDELDVYVPRLQSRVAQAVLDEEKEEAAPAGDTGTPP